nr:hypothetical protein [Deltaproteobacteria bacterium]
VADVRERLAASRGGGGSTTSTEPPGSPGTHETVRPPDGAPPTTTISVTGQLQLDEGLVPASVEVVRFGWRQHEQTRAARVRIRFWSIEPNDLEGVLFGVMRIEWRPNVSEADYAAHLTRLAAEQETARLRQEEAWRREQEAEARRQRERPTEAPRVVVSVHDANAELELYRKREEERRQRALEIVLEAERARRRKEFCARHPEDRDCWGAGGMRVYLELEQHGREREQYCLANGEDARCWTAGERSRREIAWRKRLDVATAPPKTPDGPPPAALAETVPPKLSLHAEWRPGYWQWTGTTWAWLAGMWRVPESDIVAEQTTTAPKAPPALQVETRPAPPMRATIWVTGFWQWSGADWVWVAGSWQAQPEAGTSWRPAQWRARGSVHILIPGGWVRVRGGR